MFFFYFQRAGNSRETRSAFKLRIFQDVASQGSQDTQDEVEVNVQKTSTLILFEKDKFCDIFKTVMCSNCHNIGLESRLGKKQGFAMNYEIVCLKCGEVNSSGENSSRVAKDDSSTRPSHSVNKRMVEGFLHCGNGYAAMEKWGESVGMNVMSRKTFQEQFKKLMAASAKERQEILAESRAAVRRAHEALDPSLKNKKILEIAVSYDGSWQKRGHTSLFGIGVVVDLLTGLVVDFFIVSKYCHMCAITQAELDPDSPEYKIWEEGHKEDGCLKNYSGTSGGMEQFAALILWQRSEAECGMRYTTMLSDGDSKTISHLNNAKPYGADVVIIKEECVNHVSKRLATALDKLPASVKNTHGVSIGGVGDGKLKKELIPSLQTYYRLSITRNAPNVQAMQKDIMATLKHCSSTNENPDHEDCPKGEESWCLYNRYKSSKNKDKQFNHKKMDVQLSKEVVKYMVPVYEHLSCPELLERCVRAGTQNSNESLHNKIWAGCPKTIFPSKSRVESAALTAIGEFNMGASAFQRVRSRSREVEMASPTKTIAERRDQRRLQKAAAKMDKKTCSKRVLATKAATLKRKKRQEEKETNDDLYGAGIEDDFGRTKRTRKTQEKAVRTPSQRKKKENEAKVVQLTSDKDSSQSQRGKRKGNQRNPSQSAGDGESAPPKKGRKQR